MAWPWARTACSAAAVGLVLGLLAACGSPEQGSQQPAVAGEPRVSLEAGEVDLGRVPLDQEARYDLRFTNAGAGELVLEKAIVSALEGC